MKGCRDIRSACLSPYVYCAVQSQDVVTEYISGETLLAFGFAEQFHRPPNVRLMLVQRVLFNDVLTP